ncbi:LCP family protein [Herbinix luporum]|jgi:LCP family protein required for cell wall assembly|uniref:LCP family protein n=1 Tax=Herbinix luporum TaxID=1679721 RepID=UPI0023F450AA|nr:LCP family protein [Herbinix luporum]
MQDKRMEEQLKQQVMRFMEDEKRPQRKNIKTNKGKMSKKQMQKLKRTKRIKKVGSVLLVILVLLVFLVGTKPGRSLLYKIASKYVSSHVQSPEDTEVSNRQPSDNVIREDHVKNYLIFGIEEFGGARNTDAIMIGSVNTKDNTVKLTSLLRDSYVEIPGYKPHKLNSAYSKGGINLLIETIEKNYKIHIDGYASVNFEAFEKLVDSLGGVTIELGEEEAAYLNRTNYISDKANRNVQAGINKLNGNQVMGYVRVRKVKTLGGANNDYGRVVRQQRALKAMFDSAKSPKNLVRIVPISKQALSNVTTDLSQKQIEMVMKAFFENNSKDLETLRIPVDGAFDSPKKYNGIGYPIILDWDTNRIEMYKFIFGYTDEEARIALDKVK